MQNDRGWLPRQNRKADASATVTGPSAVSSGCNNAATSGSTRDSSCTAAPAADGVYIGTFEPVRVCVCMGQCLCGTVSSGIRCWCVHKASGLQNCDEGRFVEFGVTAVGERAHVVYRHSSGFCTSLWSCVESKGCPLVCQRIIPRYLEYVNGMHVCSTAF